MFISSVLTGYLCYISEGCQDTDPSSKPQLEILEHSWM
jgi:hypothetical protein